MAKKKVKAKEQPSVPKKGKKASMTPIKDQGHAPAMASSKADVVYTAMTKKRGSKNGK